MRVLIWTALILPLVVGCAKKRELAPEEMEELALFMFRNYDDPKALEDGLDNLMPWLDENVGSEEFERGFTLTPLSEDDIAGVKHPDRGLEEILGAAAGKKSIHAIEPNIEVLLRDDQMFTNPKTFNFYDRVCDGDMDAFAAGEGRINCEDDIATESFNIEIPYIKMKDYQWIQGKDAPNSVIARSWVEERSCNDGGGNCLEHSYSVDIWVPDGGQTLRFTATWSEISSPLQGVIGDDLLIAALAKGIVDIVDYTDEFISEN